jgi:hypothetical protein
MTVLDHLVIVAESLAQGLEYCEAQLGIRPPKGGEHKRMSTHNHLLSLGNGVYLEVIAVNPDASAPAHPRWFGLDSPVQRLRLAKGAFLSTFVARTRDIATIAAMLPELGAVQDMERGALHWQITIPDDGLLVERGTLPTLIEWPDGVEPTSLMPDLGYRFERLEAYHPQPDELRRLWEKVMLNDSRLSIHACEPLQSPYLVALIDTPDGPRTISGKA